MENYNRTYESIVIGGGHAGVEAAHITARAGIKTLLITMNLDEIAQMSCNPAIGGIAKGHIVREVDALGGVMGKAIDHTGIHFKMLNRSKGAAMWSPRAQADKALYRNFVKNYLENMEHLFIIQDTCKDVMVEDGRVRGVITERGYEYYSENVIITTGTFLNGQIHIGDYTTNGGRFGSKSSRGLSRSLIETGFELGRLKTGTPPRIHADTIDYDQLEIQMYDDEPQLFSYSMEYDQKQPLLRQVPCYITWTSEATKKIVGDNLKLSALYGGKISSVGPRYCPSIEDKVVRFADKDRHQLFLEPEGLTTKEVYINGISTSLPEEIQWKMIQSIPGLEKAHIMRPAYAIEYDYAQPTQLHSWLETRLIKGLYFAGQINGTTGYEEAAGQGIVAGYNVIHRIRGLEPFVPRRDEAYIGVLIDDLVTKGIEEPYRMFTSRAEFRLYLRQDNADLRLMKYARNLGIESSLFSQMEERYQKYSRIKTQIRKNRLNDEMCAFFKKYDLDMQKGSSLENLYKMPQVNEEIQLKSFQFLEIDTTDALTDMEKIRLSMEIKYEGYIDRERARTRRRFDALERVIPENVDYDKIEGLKSEARQKLKKYRPHDLGQALRISGVDPTDIDILMIHLYSRASLREKP